MPTLKQLVKRSTELFPTSRNMARQWVRQSFYLYKTGKHRFLTGSL